MNLFTGIISYSRAKHRRVGFATRLFLSITAKTMTRFFISLLALFGMLGFAPASTAQTPLPRQAAPGLHGAVPSLAPIVNQTAAGVVNISTLSRGGDGDNPMFNDPFFKRFFGVPDRPREAQASGSGVIVDAAKGFILTNHHVIKGASKVVVTLRDRRELTAKLIGTDPATDIALLQIPAERLTAVKVGESDALQAVSYTHLDVYKRQGPSRGTPSAA